MTFFRVESDLGRLALSWLIIDSKVWHGLKVSAPIWKRQLPVVAT
jgi:hypothetical protein